jgi:hypothetical protein
MSHSENTMNTKGTKDMNTTTVKKSAPTLKKKKVCTVLRLSEDSTEILKKLKDKANKKEIGKRIRSEPIVKLGLSLIEPRHLESLQQSSVSNEDRVKALLRTQVEKKKSMTRDEFWGLLLAGKLQSDERTAT